MVHTTNISYFLMFSFKFFKSLIMGESVHMSTGACCGPKRASEELELQAIVVHLAGILRIELHF